MDWKNTELKKEIVKEEILALKQSGNGESKNIGVGSPGLIAFFTQLGLIDKYQLTVQPIVLGRGLTLFKNISESVNLQLLKTKTFSCGAVTLYYEPIKR